MKHEKSGREIAMGLLSRREHAVEELWKKLMDKGVPGREAREIVNEFKEKKLVDDRRYAAARTRYRAVFSKWGAQRIRMEMQQVGVDKEIIEQSLAHVQQEENVVFAEEAQTAVARRFKGAIAAESGAVVVPDDALGRREAHEQRMKDRQKRMAYLIRRGYSFAEASRAVDAAVAEAREALDEDAGGSEGGGGIAGQAGVAETIKGWLGIAGHGQMWGEAVASQGLAPDEPAEAQPKQDSVKDHGDIDDDDGRAWPLVV